MIVGVMEITVNRALGVPDVFPELFQYAYESGLSVEFSHGFFHPAENGSLAWSDYSNFVPEPFVKEPRPHRGYTVVEKPIQCSFFESSLVFLQGTGFVETCYVIRDHVEAAKVCFHKSTRKIVGQKVILAGKTYIKQYKQMAVDSIAREREFFSQVIDLARAHLRLHRRERAVRKAETRQWPSLVFPISLGICSMRLLHMRLLHSCVLYLRGSSSLSAPN